MNSNDIAKKYMIYPHKLNSFIKQSDLKYSRRLFNSYEVYEEPEVVYEKYIEYMKKVEAEEKAKNQKIKIKREDWMFIFDTADPDFEKKFNSYNNNNCEMPIVPKFSEKYDAVIIISTNTVDTTFLEAALKIDKEKSYKNSRMGKAMIIDVEHFKRALSGE